MMKTACINIDVDPIACYYAIHGLEVPQASEDPIYVYGIRRFIKLLGEYSIKGTFFITAQGFGEKNAEILKEIVSAGHEIADHSFSHDYRLTLLPKEEIFEEIRKNCEFIEKTAGVRCKGFRSPGYNSSPELISALKSMGYIYDSSLFPSPSYYLAKWFLIKMKRLSGHVSKSFIYSFGDAFGKYTPEFIDRNVTDIQKSGNFVELPMTTLVWPFKIPLIGTSMIAFPEFALNMMLRSSKKRNFINIEAHGIDMCAANESEAFAPLMNKQPDLSYTLERKMKRFRKTIEFYQENGFEFKTLCEAAENKLNGQK